MQYKARGGAAVARRAHNPKVTGSIPVPATITGRRFWLVREAL